MERKSPNNIFIIVILLGLTLSSTVYGANIDSSSPHSGPPKIQKPKPTHHGKTTSRYASARSSQVKPNQVTQSPAKRHHIATVSKQKKRSPRLHAKLGWRFLLKEQPQAAMTAYKRALKQDPKSANAYLGLGISLKQVGKVELAKKALLKAININPRLPSALVHLGYLYAEGHLGQTDLSTARRLFQQALQLGDPFASIALLDMKARSKL